MLHLLDEPVKSHITEDSRRKKSNTQLESNPLLDMHSIAVLQLLRT